MTDLDLLRTETASMTDREILLEILRGQRLQNGAIAAISGDFYGDPARLIEGIKSKVEFHDREITRAKTTLRAVVGLVSVIGAGNIFALLALAN